MTPTPEEREKSALASLKTASKLRRHSDDRLELSCLSSAATSLLGVSVTRFDNSQSGIDYLRSHDVGAIIRRMAHLNGNLYQSLLQNEGPPAAAVDNQLTPVHIGWLVHEWDAANTLLAICADSRVTKFFPITTFWSEYYRAIQCLVSRQAYNPVLPKLRGYEKCWMPYLNLIADLTSDRDPTNSREEIAEVFARRNCDKRLVDWEMIDGDGRYPVQWDFRVTSILEYHEAK